MPRDWFDTLARNAGHNVTTTDPDLFVEHLLPKVSCLEQTAAKVVDTIKTGGGYWRKGWWRNFNKLPKDCKSGYAVVFAKLSYISQAIEEAVATCDPELASRPTAKHITVPKRSADPMNFFLFSDHTSMDGQNPYWMDIAATGEYRTVAAWDNVETNAEKIIERMATIFKTDPRRTRAFGFTIEDRLFRMWCSTRSDTYVSQAMDFFKRPEYIIRFFFSFMYASREQCGLDPTMTVSSDDENGVNYDIIVHSRKNPLDPNSPTVARKFRTVDVIHDHGNALHGGSTRVWKVREVVRGRLAKQIYVLKDAWVHSGVTREADIVRSVLADAETLEDQEKKKTLLDCLITTIADGDVLNGDGTAQCTDCFSQLTKVKHPPQTSRSRTHNRIVFKEVCESLRCVTSLERIIWTLWKSTEGLAVLHELGWVHRDLSTGNLMLHGGQAKIADFEFAKKMTPGGPKDKAIGTPDFTAVEVNNTAFYFLPMPRRPIRKMSEARKKALEEWLRLMDTMTREEFDKVDIPRSPEDSPEPEELPRPPPWFHNPAHDMESIFWLMLYFLTNKEVICTAREDPQPDPDGDEPWTFPPLDERNRRERIRDGWRAGRKLWEYRGDRFLALRSPAFLSGFFHTNPLHPCLASLHRAACELRRLVVVAHYGLQEDLTSIKPEVLQHLHLNFAKTLQVSHKFLKRISYTHNVHVRSLREALNELDGLPRLSSDPLSEESLDSETNGILASASDASHSLHESDSAQASAIAVPTDISPTSIPNPEKNSRKRSREHDSGVASADRRPAKSARKAASHASPSALGATPAATTPTAISSAGRHPAPAPAHAQAKPAAYSAQSHNTSHTAAVNQPSTRVLRPRKRR